MGVNSLAANPPPGVNLSPVSQLQPVIDAQEATSAAHSPWHAALMNPPKTFHSSILSPLQGHLLWSSEAHVRFASSIFREAAASKHSLCPRFDLLTGPSCYLPQYFFSWSCRKSSHPVGEQVVSLLSCRHSKFTQCLSVVLLPWL